MLQPDDFDAFFEAVYGYGPFPWQRRLVEQVIEEGHWPEDIAIPTGAGKTAVIDIGVFALAASPSMPRRMVFVVDRRVVVDAAHQRATALQHALTDPDASTVVRDVANSLLSRGGTQPLVVSEMRGGMAREKLWAEDPSQPLVLCSTVDQVGSRLLFRGYGVSDSMKPVHAGLLANDTVLWLDEAHISEPFRQTIRNVQRLREAASEPIPLPFSVVQMTATPVAETGRTFNLDDSDLAHPVLARRLGVRKPLKLISTPGTRISRKLAEEAVTLADTGTTTLVVVNRVATARETATEIEGLLSKKKRIGTVVVLTGRSRQVDRAEILRQVRHRLFSSRNRASVAEEPPLFLVTTQTIEVGADIDADALVSEACPIDALRQRAGRVNRLGELEETPVILVGTTRLDEKEPAKNWEPVYGTRTATTWNWLRAQPDAVDLGQVAWASREHALSEGCRSPRYFLPMSQHIVNTIPA